MSSKPAPRLGRGLSALLGDGKADASAAADRGTAVAVDLLEPGPFQPRGPIDPTSLAELAASIVQAGILQPILVRPHPVHADRYQIIAGERRWRASQMARLETVPVVVRPLNDKDAIAAALIENLQRENLNPVEEARGYKRLIEDHGLTHQALAELLGKSRAHLTNMLRLLGLPQPVLDHLSAGRLSAGHARAVLGAKEPLVLAEQVVRDGLSVRQTESRAAASQQEAAIREKGYRDDPDVRALIEEISGRLGLRVSIEGRGSQGRVVLEFKDLGQLDGIVALLQARS